MRKLISGVCCLFPLLAGCEQLKNTPVAMDGSPLVGSWYGETTGQSTDVRLRDRLLIQVSTQGYVNYHYLGCELQAGQPVREKRLDLLELPITRLNTVKMELQSFPLTPKFQLTLGSWPDQADGVWTVDSVALRAIEPDQAPLPATWDCAD